MRPETPSHSKLIKFVGPDGVERIGHFKSVVNFIMNACDIGMSAAGTRINRHAMDRKKLWAKPKAQDVANGRASAEKSKQAFARRKAEAAAALSAIDARKREIESKGKP